MRPSRPLERSVSQNGPGPSGSPSGTVHVRRPARLSRGQSRENDREPLPSPPFTSTACWLRFSSSWIARARRCVMSFLNSWKKSETPFRPRDGVAAGCSEVTLARLALVPGQFFVREQPTFGEDNLATFIASSIASSSTKGSVSSKSRLQGLTQCATNQPYWE